MFRSVVARSRINFARFASSQAPKAAAGDAALAGEEPGPASKLTPQEIAELVAASQTKKDYAVEAAESLFAASKADLSSPLKALHTWQALRSTVPNFNSTLEHPLSSQTQRESFVKDFASHIGADKATTDALLKLNFDRKFTELDNIVDKYSKLVQAHNKETVATVTSAEPLTKEQVEKIKKNLQAHVKKGYTLNIVEKVNPKIIGGLLIDMDNMHQDLSIATAVAQLENRLNELSG